MTVAASEHTVATRFLAVLAGYAREAELLELRYKLDDGESMGRVFGRTRDVRALARRALTLGSRTDVYVGCAPRARRAGGRDAIARGFVLWVDCDGEAAAHALARFEPRPSIVIGSGSGSNRHAYWPLVEPLDRNALERANRRLAFALGADLSCAGAASILRPPGTRSYKHTPPAPVTALRFEPERRLTATTIVGALADPPMPDPPNGARKRARRRPNDPLLAIAPEVYVERLLGLRVPGHRKVPCPFHVDERPSLHVYESPERGWFCFGRCRRGGTIYDLAAGLYGYAPRGAEFVRLRAELRRDFAVGED
jgi:RepB DNA-primase from phage plasmid